MKKTVLLLTLLLSSLTALVAQTYTTPNTGVVWTLDDIAAASHSTVTVSGSDYQLLENLEIAENDTVQLDSDLTLSIDADLLITVFGTFEVTGSDVTITAIDTNLPYEGFRSTEPMERTINLNINGASQTLKFTFEPTQSILLRVSSRGAVDEIVLPEVG